MRRLGYSEKESKKFFKRCEDEQGNKLEKVSIDGEKALRMPDENRGGKRNSSGRDLGRRSIGTLKKDVSGAMETSSEDGDETDDDDESADNEEPEGEESEEGEDGDAEAKDSEEESEEGEDGDAEEKDSAEEPEGEESEEGEDDDVADDTEEEEPPPKKQKATPKQKRGLRRVARRSHTKTL